MGVIPHRTVLAGWLVSMSLGLPASCPASDFPVETTPDPRKAAAAEPRPDAPLARDERFKKLVANVKLSGHFTIDGQEDAKLQEEEYVITGATKLGPGDLWALTARIKYGTRDLTVPVPVQVKWAGDTPVITLDKVGIPGLGTFSARVVLDQGRYAGTWSHDQVGGHLFGRITPAAAPDVGPSPPAGNPAPERTPAESPVPRPAP
jgi:hypothetical protein